MNGAVEEAREKGAERLEAGVLAEYERHYHAIIASGHRANPPARAEATGGRRRARTEAANLLERLDRQRDDVLRFVRDFRVPRQQSRRAGYPHG